MISSGVANAIAAGAGNAASQGLLTGSIDPKSVLSSAVIGGLNPGGMLGDQFGLVPDNVPAGFVQGAVNSGVGNLITDGSLDLEGVLIGGALGAGKNALMDLFNDSDQFSVESEMRRIELERELQDLAPLSTQQLYEEAMFGNMTGRSDLGGLIGDDGLLSFIPAVKTGGLNNLLGGGYLDPNSIFTGPDGEQYTDIDLLEKGIDPAAVYWGEVEGYSHSLTPDAGTYNPLDFNRGGFINSLAAQQFKETYGMTPDEFLAGNGTVDQLRQMIAYGPLDETYNWSDNPRGTSQYAGLLTGLEGAYSTGSLNDQREYQEPTFYDPDQNAYLEDDLLAMGINPEDVIAGYVQGWTHAYNGIHDALNLGGAQDTAANAPDPNGGSVAIINLGGGEVTVNPNATLPGSNITVIDAITQGIIDGILVDNSGSSTGGNTAGNTAEVIGNENAVSTDDVLAGADTNTNTNTNTSTNTSTNENAVNNNDTLAGTSTNANENAVSSNDELPPAGGGGGGGGGDDGLLSSSDAGLPPLWSELFGYSKITPYEKARLKILNDAVAGLTGDGLLGSYKQKQPYMRPNRDLIDAGIMS